MDRGRIDHPANIRAVYRGLAELRQLPEQELAAMVRRNFDRLFQTVIRDLGPRNMLA